MKYRYRIVPTRWSMEAHEMSKIIEYPLNIHDMYLNVIVNGPKIFYGIEGRYRTAVIFPLFAFFIFKKPKGPSESIKSPLQKIRLLIITGFEGDVYDLIQRWARLFFGYCQ